MRARLSRRRLIDLAASLVVLPASLRASDEPAVKIEWLGNYSGTLGFHASLPLEDISPPPAHPHVDTDDRTPFAISFGLHIESDGPIVWLRIDAGPMLTAAAGETLRFGPLAGGLARLVATDSKPAPRDATLTIGPTSFGTEALFDYSNGRFWRRHFNVRFTPAGADMIVWVFDADGTRARTWRGSATKRA
jgi:hypothetical protein